MGRKTPPCPIYPVWTTARFWSFIRSALRKAWQRWPPRYEVLHDAKRTVTGKRHKYEYKCSACGNYFKQTDVQVDHTVPAGTLKDYNDLPKFVERLFVAKDELSVMCKPCHTIKSNKEKTNAK